MVDVTAFMLASKAGVDQVMNMKGDQAKEFADKLDRVGLVGSIVAFGHRSPYAEFHCRRSTRSVSTRALGSYI